MSLSVLGWIGIGVLAAGIGGVLSVTDGSLLLLFGVLGAVAGAISNPSWDESSVIGATAGGLAVVVALGAAREISRRRMA